MGKMTAPLCAIGSYLFTSDIARSFGKVLDQRQEVVVGRWALVIVSLGALLFGLYGGIWWQFWVVSASRNVSMGMRHFLRKFDVAPLGYGNK